MRKLAIGLICFSIIIVGGFALRKTFLRMQWEQFWAEITDPNMLEDSEQFTELNFGAGNTIIFGKLNLEKGCEPRFYDRVLTAQEIRLEYESFVASCPALHKQ